MLSQQNRHGCYGSTMGWAICSAVVIAVMCVVGRSVRAEGLGFIFVIWGQSVHFEEVSNTKFGLGLVLAMRVFIGQIFFGTLILWIGMCRAAYYERVIRPQEQELKLLRYCNEVLPVGADFQSIGYQIIGPPVICIVMVSFVYFGILSMFPKAASGDLCLAMSVAVASAMALKGEWSK